MMEMLAMIGLFVGCIILIASVSIEIKRARARDKQIEALRFHFWLTEIGLDETAYLFNETGLRIIRNLRISSIRQ